MTKLQRKLDNDTDGHVISDNGHVTSDNGHVTSDNGHMTSDNGETSKDNGGVNNGYVSDEVSKTKM